MRCFQNHQVFISSSPVVTCDRWVYCAYQAETINLRLRGFMTSRLLS
jgi:hypothetical protein